MIDKFNFYDIYGYLLPGILLLALFWAPFGLLFNSWPDEKFASAILGLIIAYLAGHILQVSVAQVMPPKIKDVSGRWRFPSNVLLDKDGGFEETLRSKILKLCSDKFGLTISGDTGPKEDGVRKQAFYRARSLLLQDGKKSYWEQFEGLYGMTGGLAFVAWIAASYLVGWAIPLFSATVRQRTGCILWVTLFLTALAAVIAAITTLVARSVDPPKASPSAAPAATHKDRPTGRAIGEWCLALIVVILGCVAGILLANKALQKPETPPKIAPVPCSGTAVSNQTQNAPAPSASATCNCAPPSPSPESKSIPASEYKTFGLILIAVALALVAVGFRFEVWYRELARHFAVNVWQDFSNLEPAPSTMKPE